MQDRWTAAGEFSDNAAYLGNRLGWQKDVAVEVERRPNIWDVAFVIGRAAVVYVVAFWPSVILGFLVASTKGSSSSSYSSYSSSSSGNVALGALVAFALPFVAAFASLLFAHRRSAGEWYFLLEDRADVAPDAYAAIYAALRHREIPIEMKARRVRSSPAAEPTNHLVMTAKPFSVLVTVMPYGTSLYLGWSMWREESGLLVLVRSVGAMFAGLTGKGGSFYRQLEAAPYKAMREAVHAATLEGAEIAIEQRSVPIIGAFGYQPDVETLGQSPAVGLAPAWAPAPPTPAPPSPAASPTTPVLSTKPVPPGPIPAAPAPPVLIPSGPVPTPARRSTDVAPAPAPSVDHGSLEPTTVVATASSFVPYWCAPVGEVNASVLGTADSVALRDDVWFLVAEDHGEGLVLTADEYGSLRLWVSPDAALARADELQR